MLEIAARQNARRTAIVDGKTAVSYEALGERVACFAIKLHSAGTRQGSRVALLLPNGSDFVTSYFAVVTLGAIAIPLNDQYQQTELLRFLDACGVSLLVTSKDHAELCRNVLSMRQAPGKLVFAEDLIETGEGASARLSDLAVEIDPNAPVMYQFSSGSTGTPKQIARTHANLLFELESLTQTLSMTREDRFLGVTPFSHVNGLMRTMLASLRAGATLYPLAKFERQAVAEVIEQQRISVFIGVPFMFSMLARANFRRRPDFSSLRLCISASAPMPERLDRQFYEGFGMHVRQLYGSTETGTISVNLAEDIERSLGSVGMPLPGVEVEVFTEDGRIAGENEVGEFAVRSPAAITGYGGLEDVNREVFRDGYFSTGDLGRRDRAGFLYLVGRKKFFINKGGYKINPHELETVLEDHPRVEEAAVVGEPTAYGDERVKAVIVLNGPCSEEDIIEYCRGKIARFKIPSVIEFRESLPRSPTGKIRKGLLG
ncbi:MAG: class I adenylate-forming enzyme family protein [Candidatus Binatia bacterium]